MIVGRMWAVGMGVVRGVVAGGWVAGYMVVLKGVGGRGGGQALAIFELRAPETAT